MPIVGIWLSQDHDRNPASGLIALTREHLPDQQAKDLLRSRSSASRGSIRVKPFGRELHTNAGENQPGSVDDLRT
jgi:hypothetical protein